MQEFAAFIHGKHIDKQLIEVSEEQAVSFYEEEKVPVVFSIQTPLANFLNYYK